MGKIVKFVVGVLIGVFFSFVTFYFGCFDYSNSGWAGVSVFAGLTMLVLANVNVRYRLFSEKKSDKDQRREDSFIAAGMGIYWLLQGAVFILLM